MKIEFCGCGGMLAPSGSAMRCRACGKESNSQAPKITTETKKKEIITIEDNRPDLPTMEQQCPKCDNNKVYWWLIQTRSADEPPTQFYRCTNTSCKHTWREYK